MKNELIEELQRHIANAFTAGLELARVPSGENNAEALQLTYVVCAKGIVEKHLAKSESIQPVAIFHRLRAIMDTQTFVGELIDKNTRLEQGTKLYLGAPVTTNKVEVQEFALECAKSYKDHYSKWESAKTGDSKIYHEGCLRVAHHLFEVTTHLHGHTNIDNVPLPPLKDGTQ